METKTKRWRINFATRNVALEGSPLFELYGTYSPISAIEVEASSETEAFAKAWYIRYVEMQHDWEHTFPIVEQQDGKRIPFELQSLRACLLQGDRFVGTYHHLSPKECAKRYPRLTALLCYDFAPGEAATSLSRHRTAKACDRIPYDEALMRRMIKARYAYKGYWREGTAVRASVKRYAEGGK